MARSSARWFLAALSLAACGAYGYRVRPIPVEAVRPQRRDVVFSVPLPGVVLAAQTTGVCSPLSQMRVRRVLVREGDEVRPGQALVEMEDAVSAARARRSTAYAGLEAAMARQQRPQNVARRIAEERRRSEASLAHIYAVERRVGRCWAEKREALEARDRARAGGSMAALQTAEARLRRATENLAGAIRERETARARRVPLSRPALDAARKELRAAEAALARAKRLMPEPVLRSKYRGIVAARNVRAGEVVDRNRVLLEITNLDALQVGVPVPRAALFSGNLTANPLYRLLFPPYARERVKAMTAAIPGADAVITPVLQPGLRISAVVTSSFLPGKDPDILNVLIRPGGGDESLRPGMPVRVAIVRSRYPDALTLPRSAVLDPEGDAAVFVLRDGRLVRQPVKVAGYERPEYVVREGVGAEDIVVTDARGVSEGRRARPRVLNDHRAS